MPSIGKVPLGAYHGRGYGESAIMSPNSDIRLGIVGCGDHSHTHAAAAQAVEGVRLVAACDIDQARAEAWAVHHGCEAGYGDITAMLTHARLDGVILCTWPSQHAEQIGICLAHGLVNILCEKALVTSAEDARTVLRLTGDHGAQLVEASMYRHHPAIRKLERILAYGDVGPVDSVRAVFHNYEPDEAVEPTRIRNWRRRHSCGGGVPYDWMHYLVDSCNHFVGSRPRRVFASGSTSRQQPVIDRLYGLIEYENGRVGIVESSKLANFSHALEISCAHGILRLPIAWAIQGEVTITQTHRKPPWDFVLRDTYQIAEANAFALQLANFRDVVRGIESPLVPLRDSIVDALTTEALVTSLQQGRAVDVDLSDL
jgi:predicted dehydrogenase